MDTRRRDTLKTMIGGSAAALAMAALGESAQAQDAPKPVPRGGVEAGKHEPKPLPFDAAKLTGISEKLMLSHHGVNYVAAVNGLNRCEKELAATGKDTPPFLVGGLRRAELQFSNSVIYHENYFANLGGNGKISGRIEKVLSDLYSGLGRWEELFRATAMSVGGGSGWVVLDYNLHSGEIRSYWSDHHTVGLAFAMPLLVLDMYEHAYQMDYGAAHAKYIEAFFANVNWDEVNRRLEKAEKMAAVLKA